MDRLLNLMLQSRQKRELPFWIGEITEVFVTGVGWEAAGGVVFSRMCGDTTLSLRASGTGDIVREGARRGDTGRGEPADGDLPPPEGLPFNMGETGEVVPLLTCPLMLSL